MKASSQGKEAKTGKTGEVTSSQAAEDSTQRSTEVLVTVEETEGFGQSSDQQSNSLSSSVTNAFSSSEDSGVQPAVAEDRGLDMVATLEEEFQVKEQVVANDACEIDRLVEAEIHATLETEEKEPPSSSEWRGNEEEEDNDEEGSRKEDYSEGDLVDVSAYSGPGEEEDSAGSQLDDEDDDEDDEEPYQPESSCSEIPGLPNEEEPVPPSRKICFSTEPIKVSWILVASFSQFFVFHFVNRYYANASTLINAFWKLYF